MEFLQHLWLAIVLAAVAAWMWSFLSWAALDIHGKDFKKLPDENAVTDHLRTLAIPPGVYSFPHASHKDAKSPEFKEKWTKGPLGTLSVWSPKISMPRNMLLTLLVYLVVSFLIAYAAHLALPHGSSFTRVMQITGTMGVLAYTFAFLPNMIWFQAPKRVAMLCIADGLIQGLASGAIFAALWPAK